MEQKNLEELVRDGTLTSPGDVRLAQGMRELLGFDDPLGKVISALAFAADKHRNQRRKDAHKICNLRDLHKSPPADWSVERRREHFDWAKRVVEAMRGSYPFLDRLFDAEYARRP